MAICNNANLKRFTFTKKQMVCLRVLATELCEATTCHYTLDKNTFRLFCCYKYNTGITNQGFICWETMTGVSGKMCQLST